MPSEAFLLQVLIPMVAGWMNRHQQDVFDYLGEENRALECPLGGKRVRLADDQGRRLAAKGKRLGTRALAKFAASSPLSPSSAGTASGSWPGQPSLGLESIGRA